MLLGWFHWVSSELLGWRSGCRAAVTSLTVLLTVFLAAPSLAVAQQTEPGSEGEAPARVSCDNAPAVFELLCLSFDALQQQYVEESAVSDENLAQAAATAVRQAPLLPRGTEPPPPCALPAAAFEQTCQQIDAVADTAAAVWAASAAMFDSLNDPNNVLLTPERYRELEAALERGIPFSGIGIRLGLLNGSVGCSQLSATCRLVIAEVFPESPAARAGLQPGDILLSLDGYVPNGSGCGLGDLPSWPVATVVEAVVERNGENRTFTISTAPVTSSSVSSRVVASNIGYLRLANFGKNSDLAVAQELEALLEAGVQSLVFDLQDNGGGYLDATVNIVSNFLLDKQIIIREQHRAEASSRRVSRDNGLSEPITVPMALVVNESSASASEVTALALRYYERATIVGSKTYGKNTGQVTSSLQASDGRLLGGARVTVFRWLAAGGDSAAGGIEPDVEASFGDCPHPLAVARRAAAVAGLPGAVPADIQTAGELYDAVVALQADGVLVGSECAPGLLCSNEAIPRWMMAVWLVRVLDGSDPEPLGESQFADVDASQWWAAHADRLAELEVTLGCGTEPLRFCPDEPVTRAQMASFLSRAFELSAAPTAGFDDIDGNVHAAAVDSLYGSGVTLGCSAEPLQFCPDTATSKAQMAVFLQRARNRLN